MFDLPEHLISGVALLLGLAGGVHCAAMCGGIASALGQASGGASRGETLRRALLYNAGRIASYSVAGAGVGALGLGFAEWGGEGSGAILRAALGVVIALTGLVLIGFTRATAPLEALGARAWRRLSPLTAKLSPAKGGVRLIAIGALWGWLPCGLVYTALTASLATATPIEGAAFMFAFGLGTLPSMLAAGALAGRVAAWFRRAELRQALGVLVVSYGLWTVAGAMGFGHGGHDHAATTQAGHTTHEDHSMHEGHSMSGSDLRD